MHDLQEGKMTEKQALTIAIYTIMDAIQEYKDSDWYDRQDPWLVEMEVALDRLQKMLEKLG